MKVVLVFILLVAIALAKKPKSRKSSNDRCPCGKSERLPGPRRRIVGGINATQHEFPLMAGLSVDAMPSYVYCGGTIITKNHVLTAAHCNMGDEYGVSVVLGKYNIKAEESDSVRIPVVSFINHPEFNVTGASENDVAVLVLEHEIPFSIAISPACFPGPGLDLLEKKVRFIGWGLTAYRGQQPEILQKVDIDVVPRSTCSKVYRAVNDGVLCTYSLNKDGCQGDSGGPVIYMDPKTMRYMIVGVVSRGIGCARPETPSVNTDVSYFRDWILKTVAETVPEATTCPNHK